MRHLFRALRHRNYRIFVTGHMLSLIGTWVQQVAQAWLVYRLTGSATALGLLSLAQFGPGLLAGPVAGVLADRHEKRRILMGTQSVACLQAVLLAALTFSGFIEAWHVGVMALILGFIHALDIPTRQSFFIEMVEREDLSNAIALNSAIVNIARLAGPAIGGAVIAAVGEGWCFVLNIFSFLPILGGLAMMRMPPRAETPARRSMLSELREGLRYAARHRSISTLLILHGLVALLGMPYLTIMPAYAGRVLHAGPRMLGALLSAHGAGALVGALFIASRRAGADLTGWPIRGGLLFGAGLLLFSQAPSAPLAALCVFASGLGCMTQAVSTNTTLQILVPDHLRGRIISLYTALFMGMMPLGGFFAGMLADHVGERVVITAAGILVLFASAGSGLRLRAAIPAASLSEEAPQC